MDDSYDGTIWEWLVNPVAKIARDMWAGMKRAEGVVRHAAYYANVLKEACEKKSAL